MTDAESPLDQIRTAEGRTVGANQTARAIQRGRARLVLIAKDADRRVVGPVIRAAQEQRVPLVEVDSMRDLGRACGIAVGTSAAAVLRADLEGRTEE